MFDIKMRSQITKSSSFARCVHTSFYATIQTRESCHRASYVLVSFLPEKPLIWLSRSSRWAFNSSILLEQLSLNSFFLFGSGLSGLGVCRLTYAVS